MTIRFVPLEQPPVDDPALKEWLTRMMTMVNAALAQQVDWTPAPNVPQHSQDGMTQYFSETYPPYIYKKGPWMIVEGQWVPLIQEDTDP